MSKAAILVPRKFPVPRKLFVPKSYPRAEGSNPTTRPFFRDEYLKFKRVREGIEKILT